MAIDTRAKRFSMLNFGVPWPVALWEADGTIDADDRAHLLNLYAGITLDEGAGSSSLVFLIPKRTRPSYKTGYARNASESANPSLWKGLIRAWIPRLGNTGLKLFDEAGQRKHATLNTNAVWQNNGALKPNGEDAVQLPAWPSGLSEWTVIAYANDNNDVPNRFGILGVDGNTDNVVGWKSNLGLQMVRDTAFFDWQFDWGGAAADVNGLRLWSWRYEDSTRCRLGRDYEFNDSSSTPTGNYDWAAVNRIGESSTGIWAGDLYTVFVYDRWLSDEELLLYANDHLAPMRQKFRIIAGSQGVVASGNRIMSSLAYRGGLASFGGIAGIGGGLAG